MISVWKKSGQRLWRHRRGAAYVEFIATVLIMTGLFVSMAVIGSKTVDFDRDTRAVRSAVDLVWVLDTDTTAPVQADFDAIGARMSTVAGIALSEDFQAIFTVVEFDHLGAGLRIDWQGGYGTVSSNSSRVEIADGELLVNGFAVDLRDNERLVVAEMFRARRGLYVDNSRMIYNFAMGLKFDPSHM